MATQFDWEAFEWDEWDVFEFADWDIFLMIESSSNSSSSSSQSSSSSPAVDVCPAGKSMSIVGPAGSTLAIPV